MIHIFVGAFFSLFRVFTPILLPEHRFTNMLVFLITTAVIVFMMELVSEQIALIRMEQRLALAAHRSDDQD